MAGLTYRNPEHRDADRTAMHSLHTALDAGARALHLDECGAYVITGKSGRIYSRGPIAAENGWQILLEYQTSMAQTHARKRLAFCPKTATGNGLHLDHLPDAAEAAAIRKALGIRKRHPAPSHGFQPKAVISGTIGSPAAKPESGLSQ
jgi:hypothetical protein